MIAAPFIAQLPEQITFTHFNLQDYKSALYVVDPKEEMELKLLYKLLSPMYLLEEAFIEQQRKRTAAQFAMQM